VSIRCLACPVAWLGWGWVGWWEVWMAGDPWLGVLSWRAARCMEIGVDGSAVYDMTIA
jgi:hypothetical protein